MRRSRWTSGHASSREIHRSAAPVKEISPWTGSRRIIGREPTRWAARRKLATSPGAGAGAAERWISRLLACPEVQRLRRIRALGLASLAFPGGEHSRFAHALGSAHVMQRYLDRVRTLAAELPAHDRIDDEVALAALAAALLHDLGHGPYSHTFEAVLPDSPRHETWTSRIILDPGTSVHRVLAEADPQMPAIVERLIHGHSPIGHLARAVSGTFDVDRCDYLMRDRASPRSRASSSRGSTCTARSTCTRPSAPPS